MKTIEITLQERWAASRGVIHRNRKKYTRKEKHNKREIANKIN
jgi:hypothetical protein